MTVANMFCILHNITLLSRLWIQSVHSSDQWVIKSFWHSKEEVEEEEEVEEIVEVVEVEEEEEEETPIFTRGWLQNLKIHKHCKF